ncbi:serine/threonine protein kinase [Mycobacterium sp. BK558]|nr:serine/threonine protein kinase [Mycobacterium sp. BK558]
MEGTPFGRYRLIEVLGRGGMGEVWRAHDTETDRVVALKVLPEQWAADEVYLQRFRREAHAAARLNEPHVVPIHHYGEIDGRLYVDMRLIDGNDLQTLLHGGPLVPARAVAIVEQIAMALDAAHQAGLVHRDVKPSNILIARYDFAYLIDFGVARASQDTGLTNSAHLVGTLPYMAPERFRNGVSDARSDVYSLACVLAQCLTATTPFTGHSVEEQMMGHLTAPPPLPSQVDPYIPVAFDAVVAKGMAKNPDERYQSAWELALAARAALGDAAGHPRGSSAATTAHGSAPGESAATLLGPPPDDAPLSRTGDSIDDLLDRAVAAINRGDRAVASALADQVLAVDHRNPEAEDLLRVPTDRGEIRRLTIVSADVVDATDLAMRVDPETYRLLIGRFRDVVRQIATRYEGHVASSKADGLLVVFGYPNAHEDDVHRAVQAGLDIARDIEQLSEQAQRRFAATVAVRIGVHRGPVYLDSDQDDVYGLAVTQAAEVSALAPTGGVAVSHSVEPLIRNAFELEKLPSVAMPGSSEVVNPFRVLGERAYATLTPMGPLVGRDREFARLDKSWRRAKAGTLTVPAVVLRGEAGIGKSRLAAAATELAQRDGGTVLELVGSPVHADVGLHPVRLLLERRAGITRLTEPVRRLQLLEAEVADLGLDPQTEIPLLAPILGLDASLGYEPPKAEGRKLQELIAAAVTNYLLTAFGGAPGLLLAEDAHWFDGSTLDLVGALLGATEGRLLAVITGRDGNWLSDRWPAKVFDLSPLTDEQTDELVLALDPRVPPEQCAAVRQRCGGVPFYIEQVVSGLDPATDAHHSTVPDSLYEPLFARLLAVPDVVPVVEAAAVIGRHVDRALLVAVSSLSEDAVDDVIDELEDAKVFEPHGRDAWKFRHDLLREVAAELAPPSVRRTLHGKTADVLVSGAAGEPDWRLVAAHYEQAERHADASSAYRQASAEARRRGALEEALKYLTRSLTQLELCPPGRDRDRLEIEPRLERGFLTSTSEGYQSPSVAADLERCLQIVGSDLHDDQVFGTLLAVSSYYINKSDLRRAHQLADAMQAKPDEQRRLWSPAIACVQGMVTFLRGEFERARTYFEEASAGFDDEGQNSMEELWFIPWDIVALAYEHLSIWHILHGDQAAADTAMAKAMDRGDELAFPWGPYNQAYASHLEVWMRRESGQLDRARAVVTDMVERAERYGIDFWHALGSTLGQATVEADIALRAEHVDPDRVNTQIDLLTQFTDFWRSLGLFAYQTQYDCVIGQLLIAAGRLGEARTRLDTALRIADETDMHFFDAELLRARARTHTDPDTRAADLGVAVALARHQGAPLFELRAACDDVVLRGDDARDALADALARLPADCALPDVAHARSLLGWSSPGA